MSTIYRTRKAWNGHGRNRPGMSGDSRAWTRSDVLGLVLSVVGALEIGWWDVAAVLVEAAVVEPVDPLRGRDLNVVDGPPRTSTLDQFGLLEPVDRLGQRVIVGIADGPNGCGDTYFS